MAVKKIKYTALYERLSRDDEMQGESNSIALDIRKIPDGIYAVFELPHTEQDITAFWSNIQKLVGSLSVDETKPVIERYPADKVAKHLCEFCIPLKKLS